MTAHRCEWQDCVQDATHAVVSIVPKKTFAMCLEHARRAQQSISGLLVESLATSRFVEVRHV